MEIHLVSSLTPDDESRLATSVLEAIWAVMGGLPASCAVRIRTNLGTEIHQSHRGSHADDANDPTAEFTKVESPSASSPIVSVRGGTGTPRGSDWQDFCCSKTNEEWIAEGNGTD
jgi:hypothetical protein